MAKHFELPFQVLLEVVKPTLLLKKKFRHLRNRIKIYKFSVSLHQDHQDQFVIK